MRGRGSAEGWRTAAALAAVAVVVSDHFARLPTAAAALAWAALVGFGSRLAIENLRLRRARRREGLTDRLTGLGNRRRLALDVLTDPPGEPLTLILFDLDGFRRFNDSFGRSAGDALLVRLARALERAVAPHGRAYRVGGNDFCVLARADAAAFAISAAMMALSERGAGYAVAASHGTATLPTEAPDFAAAMEVAGRRLQCEKARREHVALGNQTRDALLQTVEERQPAVRDDVYDVARLALTVGRRLGLAGEELELVASAAELHDVGKVAIPDEILQKPGPLDAVELGFVRKHPVAGERILSASPALSAAARIVRASHERWDGTGYPDGLAAQEIPLASRIIAVCDAYKAMTSARPYRRTLTPRQAVRELKRCAATHFDPAVVDAVCAELDASQPAALEPDTPTISAALSPELLDG